MLFEGMEDHSRQTWYYSRQGSAKAYAATREGKTGKSNDLCSFWGSCLMVGLSQELRPKVQVS